YNPTNHSPGARMSICELQTSHRGLCAAADVGSAKHIAGHPPTIWVGFDWLQTARRVYFTIEKSCFKKAALFVCSKRLFVKCWDSHP
ncbi:MAG: hypothetical protein RR754_06625, partial [Oscillospiraceae bacterium]